MDFRHYFRVFDSASQGWAGVSADTCFGSGIEDDDGKNGEYHEVRKQKGWLNRYASQDGQSVSYSLDFIFFFVGTVNVGVVAERGLEGHVHPTGRQAAGPYKLAWMNTTVRSAGCTCNIAVNNLF